MSFLGLSEDLVGAIYKLLPKEGGPESSRNAFSSCCKQVRNACSKQFSMLTISADQLRCNSNGSSSSNPFLCCPRNARLKRLVLRGQVAKEDQSDALVQLLQPMRTDTRLRVMNTLHDLEEISFEGFSLSQTAATSVGLELSLHSQLRVVKIVAHGDQFAPLLVPFAAPRAKGMLQELELKLIENSGSDSVSAPAAEESIKAISKLGSLHTLSLGFPFIKGEERGPPLSRISALSQLRSLTITSVPFLELEDQSTFCSFLKHLPGLQELSLPRLPRGPVLAVLPTTITSLVDNSMLAQYGPDDNGGNDVDHFCCAMLDIASSKGHLPNLQTISIRCMWCGEAEISENRHKFASVTQAMSALSNLHVSLEAVYGVDRLESFLDFGVHFRALAKNIKEIRLEAEAMTTLEGAKWDTLRALCPGLQCLEITCSLEDLSWLGLAVGLDVTCLYGARQLSSLQELRLDVSYNLKPGDVRNCAHELLGLVATMSGKKGPPLMIVVKCWLGRNVPAVQAEIDQVQRECASVSNALKGLSNSEHCSVRLQFELSRTS